MLQNKYDISSDNQMKRNYSSISKLCNRLVLTDELMYVIKNRNILILEIKQFLVANRKVMNNFKLYIVIHI